MRYCGNFKCKLWQPLTTDVDKSCAGSPDKRPTKTTIVGQCTCIGAAKGDCLRCGGV